MTIRRQDLETGRVDLEGTVDPEASDIEPVHPGAILQEEWLAPIGVSAYRLAKDIGVPVNRVTAILGGKRGISADTALRLARYFGTDAQSWIDLQAHYDLAVTARSEGARIAREVKPRAA